MQGKRYRFSEKPYDVLIVGGGIYGAWIAWDAALRGLSVALIEKEDFGHATSSNTLRILHGGLRYLQHGDIRRVRRSIHERMVLMGLAPHLVRPLPFLIPSYGCGLRSRWALGLAARAHALIGLGLKPDRLGEPGKALPAARLISREECRRLVPGIPERELTGGIVYYEAQMPNPERLLLSLVISAVRKGADAANYLEVVKFLRKQKCVVGVTARDVLTGEQVDVQGRVVVNATGPWIERLLGRVNGDRRRAGPSFSKAFNLLITRRLLPDTAVGLYSRRQFRDPDSLVETGVRLLCIVPCHGWSLVGTAHLPYGADPDSLEVTAEEVRAFLQEINAAYPGWDLTDGEVRAVHGGLVPVAGSGSRGVHLLKHHQILDHRAEEGLDGLISAIGVKYTEARAVAEMVVDLVFRKLGKVPPRSTTVDTPLHGGFLGRLEDFVARVTRNPSRGLSAAAIQHLIDQYGSAYAEILDYLADEGESGQPGMSNLRILKAQVRYGIREEMAQRLSDVVFRRTALGTAGNPEDDELLACADTMAEELAWTQERKREELEAVMSVSSWSAQGRS